MPRRVLTFGTFDDFHPGHRAYLEQAISHAGPDGELFVVVARDATVRRIKGRDPLQDEETRMAGVRSAFPNATVLPGDASDFRTPLMTAKPDLIVLGYDQRLAPGVTEADLPCPVVRAEPFEPHIHKSSLRRRS